LDEVVSISRYRISSIEPNLCTDEIISFVAASKRFMPHFHMPLQSGNNEILGLMRRRYRRELYAERVHQIKSLMPYACIGVDVITGFPGETDDHFLDTYNFLRELDIDYIHAFTYSERADTPAASMPGMVPVHLRRERSDQLRNLSLKKKAVHYERHLGEMRDVLFEKGPSPELMSGFTDNYIRILLPMDANRLNTIEPIKLSLENLKPTLG
jgi:threonylcarbamoyladenosine tRNA methylthiotransferase MtaB